MMANNPSKTANRLIDDHNSIAQWIRMCPLFRGPGFESHAQHVDFFQLIFELCAKKTKIRQERGRDRPLKIIRNVRNGIML